MKRLCPHCSAEIAVRAQTCEFCDHRVSRFGQVNFGNEIPGQSGKSLLVIGSLVAIACIAWIAVPNRDNNQVPPVSVSAFTNNEAQNHSDADMPTTAALAADEAKGVYTRELPTKLNQYTITRIEWLGTRLEDGDTHQSVPGSGDAVRYENGGYQVSYEAIPGLANARVGDLVRLQLVKLPRQYDGSPCPPGDNRGSWYRATNLRTHQTWEAADSQHCCGGA